MKTERNILIAFILNLSFSLIEFFGGFYTGSIAIISDAVHDIGDATSIGISFLLEKISKKKPDNVYTYGYGRFSLLGSIITALVLITGSIYVIYNSIHRIITPTDIKSNGMIVFALLGISMNSLAAFITHGKGTLNQKSIFLHMLEDILGWLIIFVGSVIIKFTGFIIIDPIMSVCTAIFIMLLALNHLKDTIVIFLDKIPDKIDSVQLTNQLKEIDAVIDINHIHIRSIDGMNHYADLFITATVNARETKDSIRNILCDYGIYNSTIEIEEATAYEH